MSHYHPAQYEMEAQLIQHERIEQARQWRLAQEARGKQVKPQVKKVSVISQLRAVLRQASGHGVMLGDQGTGISEC